MIVLFVANQPNSTHFRSFVCVYFSCNFASSNVISHHAFIISRFYECDRSASLILLLLFLCKTFPSVSFERHIYTDKQLIFAFFLSKSFHFTRHFNCHSEHFNRTKCILSKKDGTKFEVIKF